MTTPVLSVLRTPKGTLIAVAEARDKAADQAGNDLLVSTSRDRGKSWSKPAIAYEQGADSCNNPCLVQDAKGGRVFLFFQTFPAGGKEFGGEAWVAEGAKNDTPANARDAIDAEHPPAYILPPVITSPISTGLV